MASSETTMSYGSSLTYATTSGGSYTTLAGVKNVKWQGKKPTADVSALEDTSVARLPKRSDDGTISGDALFRKTQFAIAFTAFRAGTKYYWKINTADGSVLGPWYGALSDLSLDVPDDDAIMSPFTIELSNVTGNTPAFTPG